jgi:hypothetical protein
MNLSTNFTLDEMTKSSAPYLNRPSTTERIALVQLCKNVLQPLRDWYGKRIDVNSGYRSPLVNKHVGGAKNSQHVKGEAADITAGSKEENKKLFDYILENLPHDQVLNEYDYRWIHVSFKTTGNRNEAGKITGKGKFTKL